MGKFATNSQPKSLFASASQPSMPDGYYSGDRPNPNLRAFVEQHLKDKPYDPATDTYDVPAFNKPIETTKATAIYNMHVYWSKKPHDAIRQYIRHYTQAGDLVLDPFCGSGGTALAALMEGRKAIAIDRSPAATFITKNYCTPVDPDELREAFEQVKAKVKGEIDWLYETKCERCGGKATTGYTVHSEQFQCLRCMNFVALFDCVEVEQTDEKGLTRTISACPHCHPRSVEPINAGACERGEVVLVKAVYRCETCRPDRGERTHNDADSKRREYFINVDLAKVTEIAHAEIPHWYPPHRMMNVESDTAPWGDKWRAGSSSFRTVAELFTKRNLWALAAIRNAIVEIDGPARDLLFFGLTGIALNASRMYKERENGRGISSGTYYTPPIQREMVVTNGFDYKVEQQLIKGLEEMSEVRTADVCISTQTAINLSAVRSDSIDYIFTDPPYAEKMQYGELNFVWTAWLDFDTRWHDEEIIVNETRHKTQADWAEQMKRAMAEFYRVLRPGRWITLCYHAGEVSWHSLQDLMSEVGFIAEHTDAAIYIDAAQKSYNQLTADKVNKRDLVINFRKPKPGEFRVTRLVIPKNADVQTFRELAGQVIRDYLQANPGSTKDRVYDELVSRMVRAGTMQAHNFDELLREVAEEATVAGGGSSRWYLKEAEETQLDASEQQAEDKAAAVMNKFIAKKTDDTGAEGVHYSDLFEHYLYAVKEKPRRPLADWLPDYFFKTEEGTWRLPAGDEERDLKEKSRASGANRRIKRFANMLSAGVSIPQNKIPSSQTLAEWIRHAKRAGLYEAGKLLYERGGLDMDKLGEEQQVEVQEDYETCVRALQRAAGGEATTKKRGKKKRAEVDE
jgi:DNA modification methylase